MASIKVVGLISLDISDMFDQIITRKCIMLVVACTCFALTLTYIFKIIETKYLATLTQHKHTQPIVTAITAITPFPISMEDSRFP
jgi:hypothetical protein